MTRKKDFKAVVRARMAKTGESYTTARRHLTEHGERGVASGSVIPPYPPTGFSLSADQSRHAFRTFEDVMRDLRENNGVDVGPDVVRVWMGDPMIFDISMPRGAIRAVERVGDRAPGSNIGVHGFRGRWLVNAAYVGLVRITLDPPVRAELRVASRMPEATKSDSPWFIRPLLRDRSPKVRELTISVDRPDELVATLSEP